MAKSYTEGRNLYGALTKNTQTANLTLGDQLANDDYRAICAAKDWPFLERLRTGTTDASQQAYTLPYDTEQVREVAVVSGSTRYTPDEAPSIEFWNDLNSTSYTSDIPEYWIVQAGQLQLWPTPASSGSTIRITQKTKVIDLSAADYTDGTVADIANGATTVTGSGTTWTSAMAGRYLRIDDGDYHWYEISSVTNSTTIELVREYGGTTISGGSSAYTIGQMPLLPEAYHDLPWNYAAGMYWFKEKDSRGKVMLDAHGYFPQGSTPATGRIGQLIQNYSSHSTDMVIDDGDDRNRVVNPNLLIQI